MINPTFSFLKISGKHRNTAGCNKIAPPLFTRQSTGLQLLAIASISLVLNIFLCDPGAT
jgi:hypothetical protein